MRYAGGLSGAQKLVVTNLDVLAGFERLELVTAYRLPDGSETERFVAFDLDAVVPVTTGLPGFDGDLRGCRAFADLPDAARRYVEAIEERTGLPVRTVSVGPERQQVIVR